METHAILCDLQAPYHSRRAVDVACQILEELKPTTLTFNGDVIDCRKLALRYPSDDGAADGLISELEEELERSGTLVRKVIGAAITEGMRINWTDGNHEYRIWRAMATSPVTMQLMTVPSLREATSALALMGLKEFTINYAGLYPNGFWLRGDAPVEENFWVEHGYIVRQKASYTANALLDKRLSNVICGHVERMACVPKKVVGPSGDRMFYAIEGGALSGIGEKGIGEGIYTGIPHSVPSYMDHHLGFWILTFAEKMWYPEPVYIRNGTALFRGKIYKA